ncbi:putative quinol monooxygenase [Pelagibacterium lacus]|uniref:Antibiotic biosynthesis monooxygenase n=1 Tax=Pelagibacterium lacus TaxID=2282655 RepID=A0A369W3H5_9HYPH|nr:antibiotic biosynthesis monooxygenase [Pelagibacterium lacus]RDE09088.1 antibiotic biosynthesis monooxygenase [Pelagibacterium lacus]
MYGLIGRMIAAEGRREELMTILRDSATQRMPGCLSYVIARCVEHPDGIWVTEVWDTSESHKASLDLIAVQDAIARARPLIAGFDNRFETEPVGGIGL